MADIPVFLNLISVCPLRTAPAWWFEQEYRWHAVGIGQAEQLVANTGKTGHESGRFDRQRHTCKPATRLDPLQNRGCQPLNLLLIARVCQHSRGHKHRFQVPQITMTERMVHPKSVREGGLQRRLYLRANCRIINIPERTQAGQSDAGGSMTPGDHTARRGDWLRAALLTRPRSLLIRGVSCGVFLQVAE